MSVYVKPFTLLAILSAPRYTLYEVTEDVGEAVHERAT